MLGGVAAAVMTLGARASAALADSDAPPVETPANTGTIVIISLSVVVIVIVSVVVLRGISRARRERWIQDEYQARRSAGEAGTATGASAETPEDTP
jgi:hypothetical protein